MLILVKVIYSQLSKDNKIRSLEDILNRYKEKQVSYIKQLDKSIKKESVNTILDYLNNAKFDIEKLEKIANCINEDNQIMIEYNEEKIVNYFTDKLLLLEDEQDKRDKFSILAEFIPSEFYTKILTNIKINPESVFFSVEKKNKKKKENEDNSEGSVQYKNKAKKVNYSNQKNKEKANINTIVDSNKAAKSGNKSITNFFSRK